MKTKDLPEFYQPYHFHGVNILEPDSDNTLATCFACGQDKMHIEKSCGKHHCKGGGCGIQGNVSQFLRWLTENNPATDLDYKRLAKDRNLQVSTLKRWKVIKSAVNGQWLLPAYNLKNSDGSQPLSNVYRYTKMRKGDKTWWQSLSTATMLHQLFGLHLWKKTNKQVFVAEGPWDAMALWQCASIVAYTNQEDASAGFETTLSQKRCILSKVNIVGVPGCSVFRDVWGKSLKGKDVTFFYDNDHPKTNPQTGKVQKPAGYAGMERAVRLVAPYAKSIRILNWGPDGFNTDLPSGYDVRDALFTH